MDIDRMNTRQTYGVIMIRNRNKHFSSYNIE